MKTTNLYSEHTKKAYRTPALSKIGTISKFTKGIKGSDIADGADLRVTPPGGGDPDPV